MREFVEGSNFQYKMLKDSLVDNRCHIYRVILPPSFNMTNCRIGFEKEEVTNGYVLYIDKGLTCNSIGKFPLFNDWLHDGMLRFMDFNDIKKFLKKLSFLYTIR